MLLFATSATCLARARVMVVMIVMVMMFVVVVVMVMMMVVVIRGVGLADSLAASPLFLGRHDVQGAPLLLVPGAQALTAEHEVVVVDYYRFHPVPATAAATILRLAGCRSICSSIATAYLRAISARIGREVVGTVTRHVVVGVMMVMGLGGCGDHDERRGIPGVGLV